jgi:hypothetical protein
MAAPPQTRYLSKEPHESGIAHAMMPREVPRLRCVAAHQDIILEVEGTRAGEETAESALRLDQRKYGESFIHSLLFTDGSIFTSLMGFKMRARQDDI